MRFGFPFGASAAPFDQIAPTDAQSRLDGYEILDVRGPDEFLGPLGHVPGARLVPLHTLPLVLGELDAEAPVLVVCRSGARSAQAAGLLSRKGFKQVTNLAGGMLAWRSHGLPVCGERHGPEAGGLRCRHEKAGAR